MAEYIEREAALEICKTEYQNRLRMHDYCRDAVAWDIGDEIKALPAADVAPVVRCRDCKYSYEDIDGLTCIYGPCVDCTVPEDFYCKYGEREEE